MPGEVPRAAPNAWCDLPDCPVIFLHFEGLGRWAPPATNAGCMDHMVGDALGGPDPAWRADPFHGSPLLEPVLFLTWSRGAQDGGVWASWLNLALKARAGSVVLGLWVGGPGQPSPESACFSLSAEQVRAASMLVPASRNGSEASPRPCP